MNKQKIKQKVARYKPKADKIMNYFKEKYIAKGVGGKVKLLLPTSKDKSIVTSILQKKVNDDNYTVKFRRFFKHLFNVNYKDLEDEDIVVFLEEYFNSTLIPKVELKKRTKDKREKYFNKLSKKIGGWFNEFLKNSIYKSSLTRYYKQAKKDDLNDAIVKVDKALKNLVKREIKLGDFANEITSNPHFFDNQIVDGINRGLLLHYGLNIKLGLALKFSERKKLLNKANIYYNATSSIVFHTAFKGMKNNKLHQGWKAYQEEGEYICSTLEQIISLDTIEFNTKEVYMFENPNVFAKVFAAIGNDISLICGRGKLSQAVKLFLDKLIDNNPKVKIYYSGDFDTAGLEIADFLKRNYSNNIILWQYNIEVYNFFRKSELEINKKNKQFKTNKLNKLYSNVDNKLFEESLVEQIIKEIRVKQNYY